MKEESLILLMFLYSEVLDILWGIANGVYFFTLEEFICPSSNPLCDSFNLSRSHTAP